MTAMELHQQQVRYDRLHHQMRLQWLESKNRDHWEETLYKQSLDIVKNPKNGMNGYNSVDLSDREYLAELDGFEKSSDPSGIN